MVAIGWDSLGDVSQYGGKEELLSAVAHHWPDWTAGRQQMSASQVLRFRDELAVDDDVVTYDPGQRIYHVGRITSEYMYVPNAFADFGNVRKVEWLGEVKRDNLSVSARNSLNAIMTLFRLPEPVAQEVRTVLEGGDSAESGSSSEEAEDEFALLERYKETALEFIKDRISRLDDREMEQLVAGLLRAMGYKTRISDPGADRGVDILASPDGFGFESPRIVVEVKHRPNTAMGSQPLRTFLGGRHEDDKGLFVSTGGFTKDGRYEAERAKIPLMLMDLDGLVKALMEHYESADSRTRTLVPLTRTYWPV